jgi:hypothetical protein
VRDAGVEGLVVAAIGRGIVVRLGCFLMAHRWRSGMLADMEPIVPAALAALAARAERPERFRPTVLERSVTIFHSVSEAAGVLGFSYGHPSNEHRRAGAVLKGRQLPGARSSACLALHAPLQARCAQSARW